MLPGMGVSWQVGQPTKDFFGKFAAHKGSLWQAKPRNAKLAARIRFSISQRLTYRTLLDLAAGGFAFENGKLGLS